MCFFWKQGWQNCSLPPIDTAHTGFICWFMGLELFFCGFWIFRLPFEESRHSVACLDLCVLSSFTSCTQVGIRIISAVWVASPPDHLTSSCVDNQPCYVRFSRPAEPVTERRLAALFSDCAHSSEEVEICPHLLKKKKGNKAWVSNLPDNLCAGQRLVVSSVNKGHVSSMTETKQTLSASPLKQHN